LNSIIAPVCVIAWSSYTAGSNHPLPVFRAINTALVPPKAKEFDITAPTSAPLLACPEM
jgi:hypothetical protein